MVSVSPQSMHRGGFKLTAKRLFFLIGSLVVFAYLFGLASISGDGFTRSMSDSGGRNSVEEDRQLRSERVNRKNRPQSMEVVFDETTWEDKKNAQPTDSSGGSCAYRKLDDLSDHELYPKAGERHMITPPIGGKLSLVCCNSTEGPLSIVAHHTWAPKGAGRFLAMVTSGYFNTGVPMMRCVKGFLCQFGLNSDPTLRKDFKESFEDDPNWLPEGPKFRENKDGVKRFALGYMAYAGAGPKTRSKQLIIALKPNGPLAGGSPWEVPWGELVHPESFETLSKMYTGYGEKGPPQGKLGQNGMTKEMREEWPDLSYLNSCYLLDEKEFAATS